jgi:hypothetical protein
MQAKDSSLRHQTRILVGAALIVIAFCTACGKKNASGSSSGTLQLQLTVSPEHPSMTKPITFQVHLADAQGQPVNDAQVNGALTMKIMDMGTTQLKFEPKGNGSYEASSKSLDMSGPWSLAVDARQGGTESKQVFDVNIFD